MASSRNRRNQKQGTEEKVENLPFLARLIFVGISFAAVWGLIQVGIPLFSQMLSNMQANMQVSSGSPLFPDKAWTLESTTENKAGFFCDSKKAPCPSRTDIYTTTKPVTPKQFDALVYGKSKISGTCKPTGTKKGTAHVCSTSDTSGATVYEAYVLDTDSKGINKVVITRHLKPVPVTKSK